MKPFLAFCERHGEILACISFPLLAIVILVWLGIGSAMVGPLP